MIIPGVSHERVVRYIVENYSTMRKDRAEKEDKWLECMKAYLAQWHNEPWVKKAKEEGRSYRYLPLVWDGIETVFSQISEVLMPRDEWFALRPHRRGGQVGSDPTQFLQDDRMAEDARFALRWAHQETNRESESDKILKWLLIIGNCPFGVNFITRKAVDFPVYARAYQDWVQRAQQEYASHVEAMERWKLAAAAAQSIGNPAPPPPPPPTSTPPDALTDESFAGPKLVCLDPFEYVQDPYADDPDYALRISRFWRRKSYLERIARNVDETGYRVYENVGEVQEKDRRSDDFTNIEEDLAAAFAMQVPQRNTVELKEAWGTFDIDGEVFVNHVATIANDKTLLRFEPSYLWSQRVPRQLAKLIDVPGQLYGMGLVEMALGTASVANVRVNQQVDAGAVAIYPERGAVDDGVFDPEHAESGPQAIHLVAEKGNIWNLSPDLSGLNWSITELSQLKLEVQQLMRTQNPMAVIRDRKSATEVARDAGLGNASLKKLCRVINRTFLKPELELELQMMQQYYDGPVWAKLTQGVTANVDFKLIPPDHIRQNWAIHVVGSEVFFDRDARLQHLLTMMTLFSGNQILAMVTNLPYLGRKIWEEMGYEDSDQLFPHHLAELQKIAAQNMGTMQAFGGMNGSISQPGGSQAGGREGGEGAAGGSEIPGAGELPVPFAAALAASRVFGGGGSMGGPAGVPGG